MTYDEALALLAAVRDGSVTPKDALEQINIRSFDDLGYAKIDHQRAMRQGVAEVIYAQGKTTQQIAGILGNMCATGAKDILLTRLSAEAAQSLESQFLLEYHPLPRLAIVNKTSDKPRTGAIVVASGGTSDIPVCEEAALTAETLGSMVTRLYDVGVAGLHRLLAHHDILSSARAIVVVAGMEGALASVVGGLVRCPVIAVPTSVGYGANFGGLSALLSMLNSCAGGVAVVNIDNGFGAGLMAHRINQMEGIQ